MPTRIAILHYSAPPVIGGVEAVIHAHAELMVRAGMQVTVIAGRGSQEALPAGTEFKLIPEMDSQHPEILQISRELEEGRLPTTFETTTGYLEKELASILGPFDHVIIHNLFTKHFNLPLTAALFRLLEAGSLPGWIAWCHDFTWTSPHSRSKVRPGYPWDLLRTYRPEVTYVTISRARQHDLAGLLGMPAEKVKVIYNGVDAGSLLGLSPEGQALIVRLGLWESDLNLLMPVRVTQAKNIEFALAVTAALKEQGIRPRLVISGPPDPHDETNMEYYRSLLQQRRQLDLEQEVHFVYDSGAQQGVPYLIDTRLLGEVFRASDLLFMPSHREGFGMPVLEAGLLGLPVVVSTSVPAAEEIGGQEVITFPLQATAEEAAKLIRAWAETSEQHKFRKRIRANYTWQAIFDHDILPLLTDKGR